MKPSDYLNHLDCPFHDDRISDAPCICDGLPTSWQAHPIVTGEVEK